MYQKVHVLTYNSFGIPDTESHPRHRVSSQPQLAHQSTPVTNSVCLVVRPSSRPTPPLAVAPQRCTPPFAPSGDPSLHTRSCHKLRSAARRWAPCQPPNRILMVMQQRNRNPSGVPQIESPDITIDAGRDDDIGAVLYSSHVLGPQRGQRRCDWIQWRPCYGLVLKRRGDWMLMMACEV